MEKRETLFRSGIDAKQTTFGMRNKRQKECLEGIRGRRMTEKDEEIIFVEIGSQKLMTVAKWTTDEVRKKRKRGKKDQERGIYSKRFHRQLAEWAGNSQEIIMRELGLRSSDFLHDFEKYE